MTVHFFGAYTDKDGNVQSLTLKGIPASEAFKLRKVCSTFDILNAKTWRTIASAGRRQREIIGKDQHNYEAKK